MKRQLNELVKIVPSWLNVMTSVTKTVIRQINKKADCEIGAIIREHYKLGSLL